LISDTEKKTQAEGVQEQVPRNISVSKWEDVTRDWRKLQKEEFHDTQS
jgi:hypothetical protein